MQYAPFINLNPVHFIIMNDPETDLWFTWSEVFIEYFNLSQNKASMVWNVLESLEPVDFWTITVTKLTIDDNSGVQYWFLVLNCLISKTPTLLIPCLQIVIIPF